MQPAAPRYLRPLYLAMLTGFALALGGFHPYAEDGGVYVPGIKRLLDATLYGANPVFVLAPMHTSLFAPFVAALVRGTHIPLPWMILLLYLLSTLLTLWAGAGIADQLSSSNASRAAAVLLLACWLTLPVAGTSLLLMDPYLTARSLSTPLVLLAADYALRRRWLSALLMLTLAAALHPLMAGYGFALVVAIAASEGGTRREFVRHALAFATFALAMAAILTALAPAESPLDHAVAMTRYYWFLSQWHWYEMLGLIVPLLLLVGPARSRTPAAQNLARAALLLGVTATAVALVFARANLPTHLVARLQPLRALQLVYFVMILSLGAWLGEHFMRSSPLRWLLFIAVAAVPTGYAARQTYPNSNHFEAPWLQPRDPWQQAFLWVRNHSPSSALFAMDPYYVTRGPRNDAQTFRAIAERNILPDYSKDGGEASIAPSLSPAWSEGVAAQMNLDSETDEQRIAALSHLRPDWAVLRAETPTAWRCPYRNALVKVCALPAWTP